MSWKFGHNDMPFLIQAWLPSTHTHTLTLFHVELHYSSQNYTRLRLSTRFAWQLLSSVSCCHGNKIPASPSAPFTSLTLCQREHQQTHFQQPVCRFPGWNQWNWQVLLKGDIFTPTPMCVDQNDLHACVFFYLLRACTSLWTWIHTRLIGHET